MAVFGNYTYFGTSHDLLQFGWGWLAVPIVGIIGGLAGGFFSKILVIFTYGLPGVVGAAIKAHPVLFATLCGLIVALAGLYTDGAVNGSGYEAARDVLHGETDLRLEYAPLKLLATVASIDKRATGRYFLPGPFRWAQASALTWLVFFPKVPVGAIVLLGMVSYFTGVVQAPITSFVIVMEMTDNHQMMLPLMACAIVANAASKVFCKEGVLPSAIGQIL